MKKGAKMWLSLICLFVKLPSFSGEGDPNVYLGWEAKVEQIFHVHEVQKTKGLG